MWPQGDKETRFRAMNRYQAEVFMANRRVFMLVALGCLGLGACESTSLFGGDAPAWPGADRAAYDAMRSSTQCRPTLGTPDCRVVAVQEAGAPQALGRPAN
ncbi:hypothetical protein DKG74_13200 [Zavarzinia aquatilis]|uniref:Uncharacterized protein n=1 Tax=Zavarzinia aquatilis TaxID=2211142 RepID=A0A317E2X2_9PROT|nr:hypothetical protein DKG74_13200 [Zavarzinia aquatilis]